MALKNSQYDIIMRSYEQKQLRNRDLQNLHYKEAYENITGLKELNDSLSSLSLQKAKRLLNGDEQALVSLKEELHSLLSKKRDLLVSFGYPDDYLDMPYECPDCKDTGYIGTKKCHCFNRAVIELLYAQSNLKNILKEENFQTFQLNYYSKSHIDPKTNRSSYASAKEAFEVCKDFAEHFQEDFRNLFVYGDTGVGKTFLANCIAKELIDHSYSVIYFTAFELFDIIAKSRFDKEAAAENMYEHIFNCDLLIIDDLGTELTNSFTSSQLFLCLNERLKRRKSTMISTNLCLEALVDLYSERTFSRVTSSFHMLKLTGDDIRIKKKLMIREEK